MANGIEARLVPNVCKPLRHKEVFGAASATAGGNTPARFAEEASSVQEFGIKDNISISPGVYQAKF
jgi:hypothetical protein